MAGYRHALEERLRAATSQLVSAANDVPAPALDSIFESLDSDSLDATPRRAGAEAALGDLLAAARAMDRAASQAEILQSLLDAARKSADRAAVLLVREEGVEIWSAAGFDESEPGGRVAEWNERLRQHLLATRGALRLDAAAAAEVAAAFRLAPGDEGVVVPLVLRDRIAALLWAERSAGTPLALPPLQLLAHLAAQRLELQAISERDATPTLYESPLTPGDALPLWSELAEAVTEATPPPAVEEEPAEAASTELWAAPIEAPPAVEAVAQEAVEIRHEELAPPVGVEGLFEAVPEPEPLPFAAAEPAAPAPPPEFELAGGEEAPAVEWVPEPEPPAPAPPPVDDLLGTVRMALPSQPIAPPRPADESTAPFRIEPPPSAAATHEIPLPSAHLAPPPAAMDDLDISDDATMHSLRRPLPPPPGPVLAPPLPPPVAPAAPVEDPLDRTSSRTARSTEVAPPPDVQGPGLAFMAGRARSGPEQPQHEEARRLARLLISEIKLYNEEQVLEGRRNRDLYHRLKEDIDRSRQIYEERVEAGVRSSSDYFQQELVRSLAGGDPRALGI